jgi:hypothetical protein
VSNGHAACFPTVAAELDLQAEATGGLTAQQIVVGSHRRVGLALSQLRAGGWPRTALHPAGDDLPRWNVVTWSANL